MFVLCAPPATQAQGQPVQLRWRGPGSCPAPEQAERDIARLLGPRYAELPPTAFEVELAEMDDGGVALSVRFADAAPRTARTLRLGSCAEAQEAAVLLVAMALDPSLAGERNDLEPPREPDREDGASQPSQQRSYAWLLQFGLLLDGFSLPGPSGGPWLGLLVEHRQFWFGVQGRYLAPRSVDELPEGARARVDLLSAALSLTYLPQASALRFGPSAELELGYLRGQSRSGGASTSAGALWSGGWAGLLGAWRVSPGFDVLARGLLGIPFERPRFAFRDAPGAFHTTAPASVRVEIGLSFSLDPKE